MQSPLRFSLATLIAAMVVLSIYFAGLRGSSPLWAVATLNLTVVLLAMALLWSLLRGADRGFWTGFLICGWGYLILAFSYWSQAQLSSHLITTHASASLHSMIPRMLSESVMVEWNGTWFPASVLRQDGARYFIRYTGYGAEWDEWVGPPRIRGQFGPFLQVSHSLMTLILALAGGVFARCLRASRRIALSAWILWGVISLAVVPAGVIGLMRASDLATSIALSSLVASLLLGTIGALSEKSRLQIFALGFCLLGWMYFALHFGPGLEQAVGPRLLSSALVLGVQEWFHPGTVASDTTAMYGVQGPAYWSYGVRSLSSITLAGHCALAVLVAVMGGLMALLLARRGAKVAG